MNLPGIDIFQNVGIDIIYNLMYYLVIYIRKRDYIMQVDYMDILQKVEEALDKEWQQYTFFRKHHFVLEAEKYKERHSAILDLQEELRSVIFNNTNRQ